MYDGARMDRYGWGKLFVGGSSALLFTGLVFGPMGFGQRYTDQLEQKVRRALVSRALDRVTVVVEREPELRRVIVLSGPVPQRERQAALAIAAQVPGVAQVQWDPTGDVIAGSPDTSSAPLP